MITRPRCEDHRGSIPTWGAISRVVGTYRSITHKRQYGGARLLSKAIPRLNSNWAMAYENGRGVAQNYEEATRWYSMAAEQGDALAQNNLGWNYSVGQGVPQNYSEAYFWLLLAAEQGYAEVPDSVASHLTPTQQLEEQRRAKCWIGEHLSPTSPKVAS